jgi:asparagine synthetase B (glutamine-hydrolysing)
MCGIAALVSLIRDAYDSRRRLSGKIASSIASRGPDASGTIDVTVHNGLITTLFASVLHMRGDECVLQPVVSRDGSVLCWNGEVFGGIDIPQSTSDTAIIMDLLMSCNANGDTMARELGKVVGPWAFIFYHAPAQQIFFGRDPVGRRSLLIAVPTLSTGWDMVISSVGAEFAEDVDDSSSARDMAQIYPYKELPPSGIYTFAAVAEASDGCSMFWKSPPESPFPSSSISLFAWSTSIPRNVGLAAAGYVPPPAPTDPLAVGAVSPAVVASCALELLSRLSAAVRIRVQHVPQPTEQVSGAYKTYEPGMEPPVSDAVASVDYSSLPVHALEKVSPGTCPGAQIAVLFSGGLDSMVMAALASEHADTSYPIDLINVCFAKDHRSPDRLAAIEGVNVLRTLYPGRQWQFICVDETYEHAYANQRHMAHLLAPNLTHMDFNIGSALWFASRGVGYVDVDVDTSGCGCLVQPQGAKSKQLRYGSSSAIRDSTAHKLSQFNAALPASHDAPDPHGECSHLIPEAVVQRCIHDPGWNTSFSATKGYPLSLRCLPTEIAGAVSEYATNTAHCASSFTAASLRESHAVLKAAAGSTTQLPHAAVDHLNHALPPRTGDAEEGVSMAVHTELRRSHTKPCAGMVEGLSCTAVAHRKCTRKMCRTCCMSAQCPKACSVHKAPATCKALPLSAETELAVGASDASAPRRFRVLVRSQAKVLLLGIGADEQMGGYARHRTTFAHGAWQRLHEELLFDSGRIWQRNLGRDDRVCSDHGREVRLPYMDEGVSALLRMLPVPFVADLRLQYGVGDKRILRTAARMLNLQDASSLVKRAIHFGSRIAKQSNVHSFGSNRAGKGDASFLFSAESPDED